MEEEQHQKPTWLWPVLGVVISAAALNIQVLVMIVSLTSRITTLEVQAAEFLVVHRQQNELLQRLTRLEVQEAQIQAQINSQRIRDLEEENK